MLTSSHGPDLIIRQLDSATGQPVDGNDALLDALAKAGVALTGAVVDAVKTTPPPPPPPGFFGMKSTDVILAGALLTIGAVVVVVAISALRKK